MTNLITGVCSAWEEGVPLIVLTGNVATENIGKGAAQDSFSTGVNAVEMLKFVTAESVSSNKSEEVIPLIRELYSLAVSVRKPVHLNIPINISITPW